MNGLKVEARPADVVGMTTYEVHISPVPGVVIPHRVIRVAADAFTAEGSLFLRTTDLAIAEHCAATVERTARRCDDEHGWIRTVEE